MWSRFDLGWRASAALIVAVQASLAAAETFGNAEQARAALDAVEREAARIEADFASAARDCRQSFFVNSCLEEVRRDRDRRKREMRERELAARDALRRLAAGQRADVRAQRNAGEATAGRPNQEAPWTEFVTPRPSKQTADSAEQARRGAKDNQAEAERRRQENEERAAANAAQRERRFAEHAAKKAETSENIKRYEERQREAKLREEEQARVAEKNAQRRERRRQERERAAEELRKAAEK